MTWFIDRYRVYKMMKALSEYSDGRIEVTDDSRSDEDRENGDDDGSDEDEGSDEDDDVINIED